EGGDAARRFLEWEGLDRLGRPLVVLLGGAPGVGKSTLATLLAGRIGITRVIATDAIRHVIRAFFSHDFMPSVHYSSFEAGEALDASGVEGDRDIAGYLRQAERVRTGASGKPVIDAANLDSALGVALELVREAVGAELRSR